MNDEECLKRYPYINQSYCPTAWDDWLCWGTTPPGQNVSQTCPRRKTEKAFRSCALNGTWELNQQLTGYTNYNNCIPPGMKKIIQMCDVISQAECSKIAEVTRCLEMIGLTASLMSLIASLIIFYQYRVLKNNRTRIHKNLFLATLLHIIFRMIIYIDQSGGGFIEQMDVLSEICYTVMEYTKTAMFMWMFIEGLYLHNMITVTVFQEYSYIKIYFYMGWTVPAVMVTVWCSTMLALNSEWAYYYLSPFYWILEGPRSVIIVVNLLFLLNIIRVLIVKLKESHTSETEKVRKAVRAAIFLLPLLGTANLIFLLFDFNFQKSWHLALWSYTAYFFSSFQGFFVAVLYCFLNGEVQAAVKNSFYLRMSLRNPDYTPCKNITLVSTDPSGDVKYVGNPRSTIYKEETDISIMDDKVPEYLSTLSLHQSVTHQNGTNKEISEIP